MCSVISISSSILFFLRIGIQSGERTKIVEVGTETTNEGCGLHGVYSRIFSAKIKKATLAKEVASVPLGIAAFSSANKKGIAALQDCP